MRSAIQLSGLRPVNRCASPRAMSAGVWLGIVFILCGLVRAHAAPPNVSVQPSETIAQATQPPKPAPAASPSPGSSPVATISQPITVQAGTGVLLRLPQPAAA